MEGFAQSLPTLSHVQPRWTTSECLLRLGAILLSGHTSVNSSDCLSDNVLNRLSSSGLLATHSVTELGFDRFLGWQVTCVGGCDDARVCVCVRVRVHTCVRAFVPCKNVLCKRWLSCRKLTGWVTDWTPVGRGVLCRLFFESDGSFWES